MNGLYKKFVERISYPLFLRKDGMRGQLDHLAFLEASQFWCKERIEKYQFEQIKNLCLHAYQNTKFYKLRFDECGFDPYSLSGLGDFNKIPLLSKSEIKIHLNDIIAQNYSQEEIHMSETGGTTGVKMQFYRNNSCMPLKEAALCRFDKWAGWQPGERYGLVWPAQQDYVGHWTWKNRIRNDLYRRELVLPAAILDEKLIKDYINLIQKKKPAIIRTFTSPIMELSSYIIKKKITNIHLQGIITTGEPLFTHQRTTIEKAFHCRVFNSYRSREAGPIAQQCSFHKGLHINAESLFVEVLEIDKNVSTNKELGEIIVTDLLNYGMPLIRYRMGDLGKFSESACECGRGLPVIEEISGRAGDVLVTPAGKKISSGALVLYLVDEAPGLMGQVQILQDQINHILIRISSEPKVEEQVLQYQKDIIARLFGPEMKISFDFPHKIYREKSGKYLFTKYLVDQKS